MQAPVSLDRLYAAPTACCNTIEYEVRHIETPDGVLRCMYWLVEGEDAGDWRYVFRGDAQALVISGKHRAALAAIRRYAARHFPGWGGAVEIGIPDGE